MPIRRLFFLLASGLMLYLPAMVAQQPAAKAPEDDPAIVNRGKTEFKSSCGFCHGEDARGSRAPDLIRSAVVNRDENGNLIGPVIRNGRPDKGMPGFASLKDSEIADIVAFLHHSAKEALDSASVADDYPAAKLLTGNAAAGKAYFEGKGGCTGCHSVTGDLAGISRKYSAIDLQQYIVYPLKRSGKNVTATVTTAGGAKYEGKVEHYDEFTIAIKGQDGWYHSWPKSDVKVVIHDPLAAHRALMEKYTDADMHNLFAYLESLK